MAMRRGNPRPLPSSSSSTIQLLPGWWAVVLSSVELSIRIKYNVNNFPRVAASSSKSPSSYVEEVGHLFHIKLSQLLLSPFASKMYLQSMCFSPSFLLTRFFSGQKVSVHQFLHNSDASIRFCEMAAAATTLLLEHTFNPSFSS